MSLAREQSALVRIPTVLVKLCLDYCPHTFGQSPCTATGTPCYYTYITCQDKSRYLRGTKDYCFSAVQGPRVAEALPYLLKTAALPTEIKADQHVTRVSEIQLEFCDDAPLPRANPDKAVSNLETAGTFWRNFAARNPNYRGRPAEIWRGFQGLPVNEYQLVFKGLITNLALAEGGCLITLQDYLKKLEVKIPAEQSSENTLTAVYAGGPEMLVADAAEFAPADSGQPALVKIEDEANGAEYVSYTGRSLSENKLTGCQPGRFGTAAVSHPAGCRVSNVVVWADDDGREGLPLDRIVLDLLVTHGGISGLDLARLDRGATLAKDITATDLVFPSVGLDEFPVAGVVRIEDELIRYSRKGRRREEVMSVIAREEGPADGAHPLDQGTANEAWHFVRFETGPGHTYLDRVSFPFLRTGSVSGELHLFLFASSGNNPGPWLSYLGKKNLSVVPVNGYGEVSWNKHVALSPNTTYWLGYQLLVHTGTAQLFHALKSDPVTSRYKHGRQNTGPFIGIAGRPLFQVEYVGDTLNYETLAGCGRGLYGTVPAAHAAGTTVWLLEVSDEVGRWLAASRYRRVVEKPTAIKDLLRELRQCTLSHLWQGEDSTLRFKCAPVPFFRESPPRLTDAEHLIRQSMELDRNEEARRTRVTVYYDPLTADAGTDPEQYRSALLHLDQEVEAECFYGEKRHHEIFAPWIYRPAEALNAAAHFLMRFRYGAPLVSFSLELKDSHLQVGDFVYLHTDLMVAPNGTPRPQALFEVVKKKPAGPNRFEYLALSAAGGGMKSWAVISPRDYSEEYDAYAAEEHGRYGWISDEQETVGSETEPGYYIS